ncbi:MAG: hypothetical protein LBI57_02490 [Helicobacteraceae bacterium]|jgi:hypothetical protein|nr:hypothetical protein [Helicobacteraceae bacterium]
MEENEVNNLLIEIEKRSAAALFVRRDRSFINADLTRSLCKTFNKRISYRFIVRTFKPKFGSETI